MAIEQTTPGMVTPRPTEGMPPRPQDTISSQRGDQMNPYGKTEGGRRATWMIGGLVVVALVIVFFFMNRGPVAPPPTTPTVDQSQPAQPVPVTPTAPQPAAPTQP